MEAMTENKAVPTLRFQEFNENWCIEKFGDLGTFSGGGTPTTSNDNYWQGNIPWISSSDISENDIHNINVTRYINEITISESATKVIPKNSVLLISRVGVGKLAINDIDICTSQDFSNFIPNKCDSYFIGYFLIARKNILINFSQGTSIKGFTTSDIKTLKLHIPTLHEQKKIATFLSSVDAKLQQLSKKKSLLADYKKGLMQKIFSQELRFKDANGNNYPDWEEKKLGKCVRIKSGSSPSNFDFKPNGKYPFIKVEELNNCTKYQKVSRFYSDESKNLVLEGAIIFPKRGAAILNNKVRLNEVPIHMDSNMMALITNNCILNNEFLYYNIFKEQLFKIADTSTIPQINNKHIEPYRVNLPSLEEQHKIAAFLSAVDTKIEKVNSQIEKTKAFKKGLLQQMFV